MNILKYKSFESINDIPSTVTIDDKDLIDDLLCEFTDNWKIRDKNSIKLEHDDEDLLDNTYSIDLYDSCISLHFTIGDFNGRSEKENFNAQLENILSRIRRYGFTINSVYYCQFVGYAFNYQFLILKPVIKE